MSAGGVAPRHRRRWPGPVDSLKPADQRKRIGEATTKWLIAFVCCLAVLLMAGRAHRAGDVWAATGQPRNGTGFVVDDKGRVLTSHHVVEGCRLLAMRRGNARVGASLEWADRAADLALLLPHGALPASPVSFRRRPAVRAGERVVVAGFPREVTGTGWLRAGSAEVVTAGDGAGRFRLSVPVEPGNSGGPVFDRAARVIGVAAGTLRDAATGVPVAVGGPGVAVAGDAVQHFLRRAGVAYRMDEGSELDMPAIAERARDSTVLVECL